jgi:hypothetical protein
MTWVTSLTGWSNLFFFFNLIFFLISPSNNLIFLFIYLFQFYFLILGCLEIELHNFFNLFYVELSQFPEFVFLISTLNIGSIGNWILWFLFLFLFFIKLSRSNDLSREFKRLTWVDLSYFFIFLIDFFILSFNTKLVGNWAS